MIQHIKQAHDLHKPYLEIGHSSKHSMNSPVQISRSPDNPSTRQGTNNGALGSQQTDVQ